MKKIFGILIILFCLTNLQAYSATECWVHIRIDLDNPNNAPGHLGYDDDCNCCFDVGIDCEVVACDDYFNGREESVSGGVLISDIQLFPIRFRLYDENQQFVEEFERGPENLVLNDRMYLRIHHSTSFPEIIGLQVSLAGVITDSEGRFSVFIPTGNY